MKKYEFTYAKINLPKTIFSINIMYAFEIELIFKRKVCKFRQSLKDKFSRKVKELKTSSFVKF